MTVVTIYNRVNKQENVLTKHYQQLQAEWSRSQISNWLTEGHIKVNGDYSESGIIK